MLVLPGQGILMIVLGLTMVNFPRKREVECWILHRSAVERVVNWIRRKGGQEPLPSQRTQLKRRVLIKRGRIGGGLAGNRPEKFSILGFPRFPDIFAFSLSEELLRIQTIVFGTFLGFFLSNGR